MHLEASFISAVLRKVSIYNVSVINGKFNHFGEKWQVVWKFNCYIALSTLKVGYVYCSHDNLCRRRATSAAQRAIPVALFGGVPA